MSLDNEIILSDEELLRVSTDLDDYAPGSTAIITAEGVDVGGSVTFEVEHVSDAGEDGISGTADDTVVDLGGDGHDSWTVVDGGEGDLDGEANGTIVTSWYVNPDDSLDETFLLSADSGTESAFWSFTDGLFVNPDTGYAAPVGGDGPTEVDLTAKDSPTYQELESGTVWTNDVFGAGTGVIDPFLRIQSNGTEDGVNTSGKPALNNDEKAQANGYTRDLLLDEIALFTSTENDSVGGISVLDGIAGPGEYFFEFRLDINENSNSNGDQYISLDEMMIFISTNDHLTIEGTTVYGSTAAQIEDVFYDSDLGTDNASAPPTDLALVYDLDGSSQGDTWVALNYDLRAGSGVGDIAVYIQQEDFNSKLGDIGLTTSDYDQVYVYMVTALGHQGDGDAPLLTDSSDSELNDTYDTGGGIEDAKWQSSDGFEEWSVLKGGTPVGSIEGYKIHDQNANGAIDDPDDTGIGDWKIYLYVDDGNQTFGAEDLENLDGVAEGTGGVLQYDNADFMTQTVNSGDTIGYYNFAGLNANLDYWIVEANDKIGETGWHNSQDITQTINGFDYVVLGLVDLAGGQIYGDDDAEETDFLNYKKGSISGTKYLDEDGDGTRDTGEDTGISGITIELLQGGEVVATTETDSNGDWSFGDLEPGTYSVREVIEGSGYVTKAQTLYENIVVTSGEAETGYDFLNYQLGSISGRKYNDIDGDGAGGTDTNLTGWTISLYLDGDLDGDGDVEGATELAAADGVLFGETAMETDVTDAGGYSFTGLDLGTYFVVETNQTGWTNTSPVEVTVTGATSNFAETADFYNFKLFKISGTKYHDRNADGDVSGDDVWGDDANEGEVTVFIDMDDTGDLTGDDKTATVQSDGTWEITGLDWTADGKNVYEVLPGGTYQSLGPVEGVDTVDATSGNDQTGFDFGNWIPGKIEGTKYYDGAGDNDTPLEGWEITLYEADGETRALDADGNEVPVAYTNSSGNYEFTNLAPGTYVIRESLPGTWVSGDTEHTVTVASGVTVEHTAETPTDFYNRSSVDIGGTKYEDMNADGLVNGDDAGLADWTINIYYDADNDGFDRDDGDVLVTSEITDTDGNWTASLGELGTYFVEEVDQTGWIQSSDPAFYTVTVTYTDDLDDDGNDDEGDTWDPGLEVATDYATKDTLDFLNYRKGAITGEKYYGDTDQELAGWKVELYDSTGTTLLATDYTDGDGVYSFGGLEPGTYVVRESLPDNGLWSATGVTEHTVTVASGEIVSTNTTGGQVDFRNTSSVDIGGTKWHDLNADGLVNGDDDGLENWVINIWYDADDDGFQGEGSDDVKMTATTDTDGDWTATLTALGTYYIEEVLQTDWYQSAPTGNLYEVEVTYTDDLDGDGNDDEGDTWDPGLEVTRTGGGSTDALDFLNYQLGKITGTKREDADGSDDTKGDREGVENWKITLTGDVDGDGDIDEVVQYTDENGDYAFEGLFPGDYVLTEESKDGWFNVTPITINVDGLTSGETDSGNDFVNTRYGKIEGYKYVDDDGDLGTDGDQTGKAGWLIRLLDADDNVVATTTTADGTGDDPLGYYAFTMLPPGTYKVQEDTPDGWVTLTDVTVTLDGLTSGFMEQVDFVNFEKFKISGQKVEDKDGHGFGDDDVDWSGDPVVIYIDENGDSTLNWTDAGDMNGVWDEGEGEIWTTTGAGGYWEIDGLTTDYVGAAIREVMPDGFVQTDGFLNVVDNPGSGGEDGDNDFANFVRFNITGQKYEDMNNDGQYNEDDEGAPNVGDTDEILIVRVGLYVVTLDGETVTNEELVATTDSDDTGAFSFGDLGPIDADQEYRVRELGYYTTYEGEGDPDNVFVPLGPDADWIPVQLAEGVDPVSGQNEEVEIGNFELGKIEGRKFWDHERDGTFDEGTDSWLEGWEILLWKEADDIEGLSAGDEYITSDTSGADGRWSFDQLEAGTYYMEEALEAGYVQTTPELLGDGYFKVTIDSSGQVVFTADADSPDYGREGGLPNEDKLWFGNDQIDGPGVRTPGFWQSDLGQSFWDGDPDNDGVLQYNEDGSPAQDEKTGDEFAENDLFWLNYEDNGYPENYPVDGDGKPLLRVGDWNTDPLDDTGETILQYTLDDAVIALQGGGDDRGKGKNWGKVELVERDMIAAWLNFLAGNPTDSPLEGEDVGYWIDQAILYVQSGGSKKSWSQGENGLEAGSDIHEALDGWNNWGWDGESESYIAFDGDNGQTQIAQSYYESLA